MESHWVTRGRTKSKRSGQMTTSFPTQKPSVVHKLWRQFKTTDSAFKRFSHGWPTATMSADDRYLTLCSHRNSTATLIFLRSSLAAATGRLVSMSTAHRRLYEGGLHAKRPAICMPLTSRHRRGRLQSARQHVHWTPDQWRAVLFTDEPRFSLESDSMRYLTWREPWTRYHPSNIRERYAYGRGSVCV